jgi:hypothetical protein
MRTISINYLQLELEVGCSKEGFSRTVTETRSSSPLQPNWAEAERKLFSIWREPFRLQAARELRPVAI